MFIENQSLHALLIGKKKLKIFFKQLIAISLQSYQFIID